MEDQVQRLVDKTWGLYQQLPEGRRLMIGIAGIPGSGKTTLAGTVAQRLSQRIQQEGGAASHDGDAVALAVPMDGFHLTRAALSAMPDPETAHARRGAAFTFDPEGFLAFVTNLRNKVSEPFWGPTFDHAVKDPKEEGLLIGPGNRVVLVEGIYVALDETHWRDAAAVFDELWFVDVDFEVARARLRERHLRAGIVQTLEEGDRRAVENDLVNGKEIIDKRLPVAEVVRSREDGAWVHE